MTDDELYRALQRHLRGSAGARPQGTRGTAETVPHVTDVLHATGVGAFDPALKQPVP